MVFAVLLSFATVASADNHVHITPAPAASPHDEEGLRTHTRPLRADVELVLLPVTVTDDSNRLVTGLQAKHFEVYEGDVQQDIHHFSREDVHTSLAVVFDVSGSMADKIQRAREAAIEFFSTASAGDEFVLVSVSGRPEVLADLTHSVENLQNKLAFTVPEGRTALRDAIYLGLERLRRSSHPRKAMLIISDGGDNNSRYTHEEIRSIVREADVRIYAVALYDPPSRPSMEERLGPLWLSEITDETGGRTFQVRWPSELAEAAVTIGIELRNQYVLGYKPQNVPRDGRWRPVKVKVNPPRGVPALRVHVKPGYMVPAD